MNKRIAILRGINVGGNRKIVMVDLKKLFNDLGHENVQTYIQSGNVIFEPKSTGSDSEIAAQIERSVTEQYGFNVPVIVLKAVQLRDAISFNPFYKKDISDVDRLHITFLKELPEKDSITEIKNYTRWVESSDASDGHTSSYEIQVTGIVLKNPDDERSLTQSKYGIPLVEIQSSTRIEAEKMADALNYLLQISQPIETELEPKGKVWWDAKQD